MRGARAVLGEHGTAAAGAGAVLRWLAVLHLVASANTGKQDGCMFPARWNGHWFQSGVIQPIIIEGDRLSNKGKCLSSEGDKFHIVDEKGCYRCVVMHEKHINVLQYKETFCQRRDALPQLCSLITGDALLYSMFRENASPVACPLKGPFSFTYNRGHGDCKSPVSSIESCTEESRLLLNYQACPDVYGSESTVEELECLATWKEGSLRFLVGKVHHSHATSNEDRYRCFVYEKTNGIASSNQMKDSSDGVEYRVAQSGDATCNGLFSATEGSRTMALKRVTVTLKCQFPGWMTFSPQWHTLDYSSNYTFQQRNATLRITNHTAGATGDVKVHCVTIKAFSPSGNSVALIVHWQHHCMSRYVCLAMYKRDSHIAELQRGALSLRPEDACATHNFHAVTAPYVTLVANNPETRDCPFTGKYEIQGMKYQYARNRRSLASSPSTTLSYRSKGNINIGNRTLIFNVSDTLNNPLLRSKRAEVRHKRYEVNRNSLLRYRKVSDKHNKDFGRSKRSEVEIRSWIPEEQQDLEARRRRSELEIENPLCDLNQYNSLEVGCGTVKNMEFHTLCDNRDYITAYSCHGGWLEDGVSFVVATPVTRDSVGARRYCFTAKDGAGVTLRLATDSTGCPRPYHPSRHLAAFNATRIGECEDTTNHSPTIKNSCLTLATCLGIAYCLMPR